MRAIQRDAIAQFLYPQEEWRAMRFTLDGHPHLRAVRVQSPDIKQYDSLLVRGVR